MSAPEPWSMAKRLTLARCSGRRLEPSAQLYSGRVSSLVGRSQSHTYGLFWLLLRNASNAVDFVYIYESSGVKSNDTCNTRVREA